MIKFIVLIALVVSVSACDGDTHTEPLSVDQNQRLISQLGISGFKRLTTLHCYGAVVERINTGEWSDAYCAKTYGHLNYE